MQQVELNEELQASQEDLSRVQELLDRTNQIALVGGWEVDPINQKIFWTSVTRQIHEVSDDYLPGLDTAMDFFVKGYSQDTISKAFSNALTKGASYDEELQIITATGNKKWVRAMGIPEFEGGQCTRVYGTFQDIDIKKKNELALQKSLENTQVFVEQCPSAIAMFDTEVRYLAASEAWVRDYQLQGREIVGKSHYEIFPEIDEDWKKIHQECLSGAVNKQDEASFQRADGSTQWLSWEVRPWYRAEGEIGGLLMYTSDVSEKKEAELAIVKAKIQAENASLAKSEFLANMSHEIRTPLNGVIGFSDLMMKSQLNEHQQHHMRAIHTSADALLSLINDILDFSKIEAGKLELAYEKTDLWELVSQVIDIVRYKTDEKNIELLLNVDHTLPRFARVDSVRIRQILTNLLSNAVKFTQEGEIELSVQCVACEATESCEAIRFSVKDSGIGIAEDRQEMIFKAFTQEDVSTTRTYGGTGLGLSISNQLLKMMGSRLTLESSPGLGSTFFFTITVDILETEPADEMTLPVEHVLVVDDQPKNSEIIQGILTLNNITADIADNGLSALDMLKKGSYDALVVDYHMPYMNGLEMIRIVREELGLDSSKLPVLFVHSSADDAQINEQRQQLGIAKVISKPVTIFQLTKALQNLYASPAEVEEITKTEAVYTSQSLQILLVDDNPLNLELAEIMITQLLPQAVLKHAQNGRQAVEVFEQNKFDLILMDVQMPEMSGYQASEEIRKLPGGDDVIIIALTAATVKGERERCLEAGMDDYLSKPIVIDTLGEKVFTHFNSMPDLVEAEGVADDIPEQHFNRDKLLKNLGNENFAVMQSLVQRFFLQLEKALPDLWQAFRKEDIEQIHILSHRYKSTATALSMSVLSDLFVQVEDQIELNKHDMQMLLEQIEQEISQVRAIVEESFQQASESGKLKA